MSIKKLIKALNEQASGEKIPKGFYTTRDICNKTKGNLQHTREKLNNLVKEGKAERIFRVLKIGKAYIKTSLFKTK